MRVHAAPFVRPVSKFAALALFAGAILFITTPAVLAQVQVTGFYSQVGTDFLYNFEVFNASTVDISIINALFPTQQPSLVISNEITSGDFLFDYDSGSLVFGEGSSPFLAGSTVSGFSLTSNTLLAPDSVEAFDVDTNTVTATFVSLPAVVPEAGTLSLFALATTLTGVALSRRRTA